MKVTDDKLFNTTVSFNAIVHMGGFSSQEHTKRSAIQRFRDPVRRNTNVLAAVTDIANAGQLATRGGAVLTIARVNSNATGPGFTGTVDRPFSQMTQDWVRVRISCSCMQAAISTPHHRMWSTWLPVSKWIGEGFDCARPESNSTVTVDLSGQATTQVALPKSPTPIPHFCDQFWLTQPGIRSRWLKVISLGLHHR